MSSILGFVSTNLQPDRDFALYCIDIIQNSAPAYIKCICPYEKSKFYTGEKERAQRIAFLKQCLIMNKQETDAMKVFYNDVKVELAVLYTINEQLEDAKQCLNEVRRFAVDSDSGDSWQKQIRVAHIDHLMGNVFAAEKDYARAIAYYKKAITQLAKLGKNGLNDWTNSINSAISCAQAMNDKSELQNLEVLKKAGVSSSAQ